MIIIGCPTACLSRLDLVTSWLPGGSGFPSCFQSLSTNFSFLLSSDSPSLSCPAPAVLSGCVCVCPANWMKRAFVCCTHSQQRQIQPDKQRAERGGTLKLNDPDSFSGLGGSHFTSLCNRFVSRVEISHKHRTSDGKSNRTQLQVQKDVQLIPYL